MQPHPLRNPISTHTPSTHIHTSLACNFSSSVNSKQTPAPGGGIKYTGGEYKLNIHWGGRNYVTKVWIGEVVSENFRPNKFYALPV